MRGMRAFKKPKTMSEDTSKKTIQTLTKTRNQTFKIDQEKL